MESPQNYLTHARKFYGLLVGYIAIIFIANWHHTNQQGIFLNEYEPIAKHLLGGDGYVIHSGTKILYPIWGYSFITTIGEFFGSSIFFLAFFQAILCVIGIYFFYKLFNLEKRYWHILLFTPYIALLSVRWPDAIVAVLLIIIAYYFDLTIKKRSNKSAIVTGILLGVLLNFRSEYLGLLFLLLIGCIISLILKKRIYFSLFALPALFAILFLIPWTYYSYSIDNHLRISATNGGGVLYISLGQLPDNPWGIVHSDSVAYAVAKENGIDDPYSPKGDSLLSTKFINDVESNSYAFRRKIGHNLFASFERGVYIGEYSDLLEKVIKIAFIFIFDLFVAMAIYSILKNFKKSLIIQIVLAIILYKFALITVIQYEPRHMNAIYLFLFGLFLRPE